MKYQLRLVLFFMLCVFASSATDKDKEECTQSLIGLATCLPYVGGDAPTPTPDCCTGLKQVLKSNKKCLCFLIKDRNDPDLGLQINVTLALTLPSVCQAFAIISECPVGSSTTGGPAGVASAPKSAGCHIGKRWFGLDATVGALLLWSLTSNFFI